MCGISGYFSAENLNVARMLQSQKHRGPDHSSYFEEIVAGKKLCLAHNRLAILDLSERGNQPMFSEDKNLVIVFNGEIYNYPELREKYCKGKNFFSGTDTEVILELYRQQGINCIRELNGDFAIALYDKNIGKFFLVRDRAGVKPLYYYSDGKNFIFGSEIKSIIAAGVQPVLNEDEILNYFVFKYSPQNRTLFKNILRLPTASVLEYDLNRSSFNVFSYWKPEKKETLSYSDAKESIFHLVEESTRMRLISDVPIGNFLSGGLDSSIIAYFLRERKDIIHYCAKKSEEDLKKEGTTSDYGYAERLAAEWELHLEAAPIGNEEASRELIDKTLFYGDDLIADGSQIPSWLITRAASEKSRVILSGMGADELFLGYAGHLLTLLSSQYLSKFPSFLVNQFSKINQGRGKALAYRRYIHKLGKYHSLPLYKYALFNIAGDFENSASVYTGGREACIDIFNSYFNNSKNVFDNVFHFEMENFLVKNLNYSDRMSMANSVECRVPFLDHRLIELAYTLPVSYKLPAKGEFKKILKDAFRDQIPDYILRRRKAGFGMPLRSIFMDSSRVYSLLDKGFFANFKKFSVENIERVVERHVRGEEDNSSIIYALISFQEWYKLNFR
jgi:asparagine synthase (glutamine-hydrolysing)